MKLVLALLFVLLFTACHSEKSTSVVEVQNPIIPGYFADPSVVEYEGKFYMYATVDPWGGDFLSCWVSDDFRNWSFNKLNWPTKEACTSPLSNENMVWAPSVIQHGDAFYMYISVGSEIWAGKASHPLGPWENMLGDQPLVPFDTTMYTHEIDAEAFVDDDGKVYLYWGSGWNWTNGRCWVAELAPNMASFASEKKEVTPDRFFEGAWMIKHQDTYYLTYSEGKTIEDSYEVRYATGDSPWGPFTQAANSPILTKDESLEVYGPGHHTIVNLKGQHYILYHKHSLPFRSGNAMRQISMNPLHFDAANQQINNIVPEHRVEIPLIGSSKNLRVAPTSVSASSYADEFSKADNATDQHYGTLWRAAADDEQALFTAYFDKPLANAAVGIRFEYPWKLYYCKAAVSEDGVNWTTVQDYTDTGIEGSPVVIPVDVAFRYFRLQFTEHEEAASPAIWEIEVE